MAVPAGLPTRGPHHDDNSRERAVAAAMARLTEAGQASGAISTASARSVVPPGLVTARRMAAASSSLAASSAPDPAPCAGPAAGPGRRQPLLDRRRLQQFGQQEHVGRAAAGGRGHGVDLRLVVDPGDLADRCSRRRTGRAAPPTRRAGERGGEALADRGGRVGHGADDGGGAGQRRRWATVRPAMIDTTTRDPANARHAGHRESAICGLTASTTASGRESGRDGGRPRHDRHAAPASAAAAAPGRPRSSVPAPPPPAGQHGAAHLAAAEQQDGDGGHASPTHSSMAAASASAGVLPPHSTNWNAG